MSPQFWSQFKWQFGQGLHFLLLPPVLLVLAALLVNLWAASLQARKSGAKSWRPFPWLMLSQFLAWPAIITIGVLGKYHAPPGDTSWGGDPVWWASWSMNGI